MSDYKIYNILGQEYILLKDLDPDVTKEDTETQEVIKLQEEQSSSQKLLNFNFSQDEIDHYWQKAAKSQRREIFMNTIRPILKKELGYDFSEILLEKKAKILCARWIYCEENNERYEGPYLID